MAGGHEAVPPEIAKTLVGWKKHFNAYTVQGRYNVRINSSFIFICIYLFYCYIHRPFCCHWV